MSLIETAVYRKLEIHESVTWVFRLRVKPDSTNAWDYSGDVSLIRASFRQNYADAAAIFAIDSSTQIGDGGSYVDTSDAANGWITLSISAADTAATDISKITELIYDIEMVVPAGTTWSATSQTLLGVTGTTAEEIVLKPLRGSAKFIPAVTY